MVPVLHWSLRNPEQTASVWEEVKNYIGIDLPRANNFYLCRWRCCDSQGHFSQSESWSSIYMCVSVCVCVHAHVHALACTPASTHWILVSETRGFCSLLPSAVFSPPCTCPLFSTASPTGVCAFNLGVTHLVTPLPESHFLGWGASAAGRPSNYRAVAASLPGDGRRLCLRPALNARDWLGDTFWFRIWNFCPSQMQHENMSNIFFSFRIWDEQSAEKMGKKNLWNISF